MPWVGWLLDEEVIEGAEEQYSRNIVLVLTHISIIVMVLAPTTVFSSSQTSCDQQGVTLN
jgi:hypothetical protein